LELYPSALRMMTQDSFTAFRLNLATAIRPLQSDVGHGYTDFNVVENYDSALIAGFWKR